MKIQLITALLGAFVLAGCGKKADDHAGHDHSGHDHAEHADHKEHDDHAGHDHSGHDHASHDDDGHEDAGLLEVGAHKAHLRFEHDETTGKVTIEVLGADAKSPMAIAEPPVLNLTIAGARAQIKTAATAEASNIFTASSDQLKAHVDGVIRLKIDDKSYSVDLPHHDHDH